MVPRPYRYARFRCDRCDAVYDAYYPATTERELIRIVRDMHARVCVQRQDAKAEGQTAHETGFVDGDSLDNYLPFGEDEAD